MHVFGAKVVSIHVIEIRPRHIAFSVTVIKERTMNNYKHEQLVKNFFKQKGLDSDSVTYPHSVTYSDAKAFAESDITTEVDKKRFNKFCRHWFITQGNVEPKHLERITKMLKYYKNKRQNNNCKKHRLQTRAV